MNQKLFVRSKVTTYLENDLQKYEFFLNAYSNLYGSLSQFKFEIHNTTTLFESRFQEYEKVYYKS